MKASYGPPLSRYPADIPLIGTQRYALEVIAVPVDVQSDKTASSRSAQPLLLIDVRGSLTLSGSGAAAGGGVPAELVDVVPHVFSLEAAAALVELDRNFECVWCPGWEQKANEHLPWL